MSKCYINVVSALLLNVQLFYYLSGWYNLSHNRDWSVGYSIYESTFINLILGIYKQYNIGLWVTWLVSVLQHKQFLINFGVKGAKGVLHYSWRGYNTWSQAHDHIILFFCANATRDFKINTCSFISLRIYRP